MHLNLPVKTPVSKPVFFQPKLTVNQPNDSFEREADAMADRVMGMRDTSANASPFFKPAAVVQQVNQRKIIQRHRQLDDTESVPCLKKAEDVIQTLEKNMGAGANFGQQPYIKGAVQILRSKMNAKKIKCYAFEGRIHGVTDYSGDEVRLDGVNLNWIDEGTLLHEGVHAYHASQHPDIAKKYADALKAGQKLDPSNPADLKLLKWKAWTEYWGYRAKNDYYNPTRRTPMTEDEIDQAVMANPDVGNPVRNARQGDPNFNPKTYNP